MTQGNDEVQLSEQNLSAFADKLDSWAEGLPVDERSMLQFLLARAEASGSAQLVTSQGQEMTTGASPGQLASAMLQPLLERGVAVSTGPGGGDESSGVHGMMPMRPCNWSTWSRGVSP